ncbi:unnamed protein product [Knipowitschia caucasica]
MPKKTKGNGEKQEQSKKRGPDSAAKVTFDEKEKIVYLAQIQVLSEKVERFEKRCCDLEAQKKQLTQKLGAAEQEKADMVDFLTRSLLEKEEEAERLSEELQRVQQEALRDGDDRQQQHREHAEQIQHRADAAEEQNKALVEKLSRVEQFLNERETLMSDLSALRNRLSRQEEEHRVALHDRDMQALVDKSTWEKKLKSHTVRMEAEVERLVSQRLPEATSRTLQQNQELRGRFSQLSQHTQGLVEANAVLNQTKTRLQLDVENLEEMLREVSRKNCLQKRTVEQLNVKCSELQTELQGCRGRHDQLHSLHSHSMEQMETLRQDKASVFTQCNEKQDDICRLEAELQQETRKRSEMKSVIQKGCIILQEVLMEVCVEEPEVRFRWKPLMEELLQILRAAL